MNTYTKIINVDGQNITVNYTDEQLSWRIVHDDISLFDFFNSSGITETINKIEVFQDRQSAIDRILNLGLTYSENINLDI